MTGARYRVSWSPDWADRGLCAGDDNPDRWHPNPGQEEIAEQAAAVCRSCPVVEMCREYAIATDQPHGIWGALDPKQRRKIARDRRRQAEPSRPAAADPSTTAEEVAA